MTNWTTGVCDGGGASIHYLRTGRARPPLVLLHGLTANGACWSPVARLLEGEFDVVMPDARGHGKSSAPRLGYQHHGCGYQRDGCEHPYDGYGYDDHASDVVGLIRGLGLGAPILLGHSMGGMTAAMVASQMGNSIGGVILADPTFLSPQRQREVYKSDVAEQHRRLLSLNKDDVLAQARTRHPDRSPEILELLAEARLQTRMSAFDVLRPPNPEYQQLVSTICVPILLVIGDAGAVVSLEIARELQIVNPRVRVEQIQGAGHGLQYDQPERFAAVVRCFLKSVATA
jgi:pimeloyl-ACP methyl ester carboxylesterase